MVDIKNDIAELTKTITGEEIISIIRLPQSGGDREYYRVQTDSSSFIATFGKNKNENARFLYLADVFSKAGLPVPEVQACAENKLVYLQEDAGDESLFGLLQKEGLAGRVKELYKKSLEELARLQILGLTKIDHAKLTDPAAFDKQAILNDLLYFKFYFLDTQKIVYNREKLFAEFDEIAEKVSKSTQQHFMYRDFQSRNILIKNEQPVFIDFQGGMKGPIQYDAASLLWQAKAKIPQEIKEELFDYYTHCVKGLVGKEINEDVFTGEYVELILIRLLQVLGAYGFRGLFERKEHFSSSIPEGLKNLQEYIGRFPDREPNSEIKNVLEKITAEKFIARFENVRAENNSKLLVSINSFSFLKTGYPKDESGNGGGFVFDCRGILNPGRVEIHKQQTGRDEPVQKYLIEQTRMDEFLANVFHVVEIAVEDYIKRDFENLSVNFGCTGGQHRSVYAADALAKHLFHKYNVKTRVRHLEQNFSD